MVRPPRAAAAAGTSLTRLTRLARRPALSGREHSLFAGKVIITVHPQIPAGDADEMCAAAQKAVESALKPQYRA